MSPKVQRKPAKRWCDIKIHDDADPKYIQHILAHGFKFYERNMGKNLIYRKGYAGAPPIVTSQMAEQLTREIDRICMKYYDKKGPNVVDEVVGELLEYADRKAIPNQRAFVIDWIKVNIQEVDDPDDLPW